MRIVQLASGTDRPSQVSLATKVHVLALLLCIVSLSGPASSLPAQIPTSTYDARHTAVLSKLGPDVMLVPARGSFLFDDQMGFMQAPDFQYLTGMSEQIGAVLLLDGSDRSATLYVPRPSPLISLGIIPPTRAAADSLRINNVVPIDSLEPQLRRRFAMARTVAHVSATDARGAVSTPLPMASSGVRWRNWVTTLGAAEAKPALPMLRGMREIKSAEEIAILRRVGAQSGAAMLAGMRALRDGQTQRKAELAVVNACETAGARSVSFWPWTMSGPNARFENLFSSFQSYEHIDRVMRAGEVVRVDVGCQSDHYMGDVGRTAPVSGRFTAGQREAWDLFIAGYRAGMLLIKDGAAAKDILAAALAEIRRRAPTLTTPQGKHAAETLLSAGGTAPWQLHGVGLDDAEGQPEILRTGMTVAYELMFVVDGDGFYLEDMIAVGATGPDLLTPGLPYTADEIERAMTTGSRTKR